MEKEKSICRHCGMEIVNFGGRLWYDWSIVFPQYCPTKYDDSGNILLYVDNMEGLHEPKD